MNHLAFMAHIQAADEADRPALLMEFSLAQLPEKLHAALRAAAVPHWFDHAFLNTLLRDGPLNESEFRELTSLSFVKAFPNRGWNVHEHTRIPLLQRLWQEDRARYQEISRLAVEYGEAQDPDDSAWCIETVFHRLIADSDQGKSEVIRIGWQWQNSPNFAYDRVELLARAAREQLDAGRLSERSTSWTLFWEAHLDKIYSRNREAKDKLLQIRVEPERDSYNAANRLKALGYVHLRLSETTEARGRYEQALPLYQAIGCRLSEANCIRALGDVHLRLSETAKARGRYEQAQRIYHAIGQPLGKADSLRVFGNLAVHTGDYDAAHRYLAQASAQFESVGCREGVAECLEGFGSVYTAEEKLAEAADAWAQAALLYE